MFEDRTYESIKERMLLNAPDGINTREGEYFNDSVSPGAIELALAYQQLDSVLEAAFADTSTGQWLEKIAAERGISRKPATKGKGKIEVTAAPGSKIRKGDVLATLEGNVRFTAAIEEDVTVDSTGKALVDFENETAGNQGNIPANTGFGAPVALSGFISAQNPEDINAGTDEEDDEALRQRYFEAVRTPSTSGNKHHYRAWAKEVKGVGDAKVIPHWLGPDTVKVVLIDSNGQPASDSIVTEVQEYIDPGIMGLGDGKAPIGAKCTVIPAQRVEVNIEARVVKAPNQVSISLENIKASLIKDLEDYFKSIAFKGYSASYSQIGAILLDCISREGGLEWDNLKLNGGNSNLPVGEEEVAVTGMVTLYE